MAIAVSSQDPLKPHPSSPGLAVSGVGAGVGLDGDGRLRLAYRIQAPPDRLCWDRETEPGRRDQLWRRTCCEAFLATGQGRYLELNFAPDGSWACYRFSAYRQRAATDPELPPPRIRVRSATGWLSLQAEVDLGGLIRNTRPADLRLGLAAVVAEVDGPTSYWALVHPAEAPDFHHDDGFLLTMVPESASGSFEEPAA